jgi:hypothetical protein
MLFFNFDSSPEGYVSFNVFCLFRGFWIIPSCIGIGFSVYIYGVIGGNSFPRTSRMKICCCKVFFFNAICWENNDCFPLQWSDHFLQSLCCSKLLSFVILFNVVIPTEVDESHEGSYEKLRFLDKLEMTGC